jgi:hypothetical protein
VLRATLLAVTASLALVACGGHRAASPAQLLVAHSADRTASVGSEHVHISGYVVADGQTVNMSGDGDFQSSPQVGQASLRISGGTVEMSVDEVMKDWTIYVRSPLFARLLPEGATWASLDLRSLGSKYGIDLGQLSQVSPNDSLSSLKKAGSVQELGTAMIHGVATTHYEAVVDLGKLPGGKSLAKLVHLSAVPIDVWVDGRGLMRRMVLSAVITANGQTAATRITMDLSKFGEPVHVTVPSPADTYDLTSLGG